MPALPPDFYFLVTLPPDFYFLVIGGGVLHLVGLFALGRELVKGVRERRSADRS